MVITSSADFPVTTNTGYTYNPYVRNYFVRKYDGSGNLVYATAWGSSEDDWPRDLTLLDNGGVAVAGYTQENTYPVTDGSIYTGGRDAVLNYFRCCW